MIRQTPQVCFGQRASSEESLANDVVRLPITIRHQHEPASAGRAEPFTMQPTAATSRPNADYALSGVAEIPAWDRPVRPVVLLR